MEYTGFKFCNSGNNCRVYEYHLGCLVRSWFVYANYIGGDIKDFIMNNKHFEEFCFDFDCFLTQFPLTYY